MIRNRRSNTLLVLATTAALLALPASYVFAADIFSDVPNSPQSQHDAVNAIFRAGITAGCGGTKFCPRAPVTRGQMAIFLNRLGALSLGPGGIPKTVVDALSVQGTTALRYQQIAVKISGTGDSFCTPTIALAQPAAFGKYALVFKLFDTPVGIEPYEVNVQLRDDAADGYVICLKRINGTTTLPDGEYKLFGAQMTDIGQGRFR